MRRDYIRLVTKKNLLYFCSTSSTIVNDNDLDFMRYMQLTSYFFLPIFCGVSLIHFIIINSLFSTWIQFLDYCTFLLAMGIAFGNLAP